MQQIKGPRHTHSVLLQNLQAKFCTICIGEQDHQISYHGPAWSCSTSILCNAVRDSCLMLTVPEESHEANVVACYRCRAATGSDCTLTRANCAHTNHQFCDCFPRANSVSTSSGCKVLLTFPHAYCTQLTIRTSLLMELPTPPDLTFGGISISGLHHRSGNAS